MTGLNFNIIKLLILTTASFLVALFSSPIMSTLLYKFRFYKSIRDSESAPIYASLHAKKAGTPVGGGILIWVTLALFFILLEVINIFWPGTFLASLSFFSRAETLLPFGALIAAALVGLYDDYLNVRRIGPKGGGLSVKHRLLLYFIIAAVGAWWFYIKLDWDLLHIPFLNSYQIGWWYIVLFIFVIVATSFSVNETDGLDGLAGGTLLIAFSAYTVIAMVQGKYSLAAFLGVIIGGLLAFLWYNIGPARYFMGDTGVMALGTTLGIVAVLTNTIFLLPLIGSIFVFESLSVIVQVISKKFRGKKIFLSTPIHHHFEAIGWPESKVVMRFWLLSGVFATMGLIIFLLDRIWF